MIETAQQLDFPTYLLNFPFSLDTTKPNNIWMSEMAPEELIVNRPKAYRQFMDLYNFMAANSLVYLLPSQQGLQDQVYVANLGITLPHLKDRNVVLLSNFTSLPRVGEEKVGEQFFKMMGYETYISPNKWEGEADLKYLGDNTYIGGYGIRSNIKTYEWMEKEFGMKIIKVEMVEEYLYHLDCSMFPVTTEKVMVCTELFEPKELKAISKHSEIIDVHIDDAFSGITNSVRLGNMILCASNISELSKGDELYKMETQKIAALEKICSNEGMEPVIFNLSEFCKSGALLSCCVQNLNFESYKTQLL